MSEGKYFSLEDARKEKELLKRFQKEHPSAASKKGFDSLLFRMVGIKKTSKDRQTLRNA